MRKTAARKSTHPSVWCPEGPPIIKCVPVLFFNDVEGRALADKIDFRLSELAQKMGESQGKTPF